MNVPNSCAYVSVSVEVVGLSQPLPKLIIDLITARQVDHVNDPVGGSWQRTGDPHVVEFVREIEAQEHRPYAGPELRDFAIALEKDPYVDRVLVKWPETAQMLHDGDVDLAHPKWVASQEVVDGDARDADMRLISRREFPLAVWAYPTGHAADCAATMTVADQTRPRSRVPARG